MPANPPAILVAEAPGLDFLNSIATPADAPVDWLGDGRGLIDWLGQAQLVPAEVLQAMAAHAAPKDLDRVAEEARALREWFRGFVRAHMGTPLGPEALAALQPLNRLLEGDERYGRIAVREGRLDLETVRRWRSPEFLLIALAEAMARVVVEEDFSQVKPCQGHNCTLLFADRTRARVRRWCSMAICGNRAKQKDFRQRRRARDGAGAA